MEWRIIKEFRSVGCGYMNSIETDSELDQTIGFYCGGVALSNNRTARKFLDEHAGISVPDKKPATAIALPVDGGTWYCIH
jgi:hypothetical protein